jgi:hypothetical protein
MKVAFAAFAACAFVTIAFSQEKATTPSSAQPTPPQAPEQAGTSLNLKLEDPALSSRPRIRFGPAEQRQDAGGLPSLGADARKAEEIPRSGSRASPYPPDTNPGR